MAVRPATQTQRAQQGLALTAHSLRAPPTTHVCDGSPLLASQVFLYKGIPCIYGAAPWVGMRDGMK